MLSHVLAFDAQVRRALRVLRPRVLHHQQFVGTPAFRSSTHRVSHAFLSLLPLKAAVEQHLHKEAVIAYELRRPIPKGAAELVAYLALLLSVELLRVISEPRILSLQFCVYHEPLMTQVFAVTQRCLELSL